MASKITKGILISCWIVYYATLVTSLDDVLADFNILIEENLFLLQHLRASINLDARP